MFFSKFEGRQVSVSVTIIIPPPLASPTRRQSRRQHGRPQNSASKAKSADPPQLPPGYLLRHEKAHGQAGAGIACNQKQVMRLMGLVDHGPKSPGEFRDCEGQWQCPISDNVIKMITMVSGHSFCSKVQREGHNDGYVHVHMNTLCTLLGSEAQDIAQCDCVAHTIFAPLHL